MLKLLTTLLVIVALAMPAAAFAEPGAVGQPTPQPAQRVTPPAAASSHKASDGARYFAEGALGVLTAAGGSMLGTVAGSIVGFSVGDGANFGWVFYGMLGALAGGYLAMPLGVYKGGNYADGTGSLGGSYLGGLAGVALSVGAVYGTAQIDKDTAVGVGWITGAILPLAGSMIGYEMTSGHGADDGAMAGPVLMPSAGPTSDGGFTVGLGAIF